MAFGPPCKKARKPDKAESTGEESEGPGPSAAVTHIYDLKDCLHVIAKHLPLSSRLRSRLVCKTFADVFGWHVNEMMQLVGRDPDGVLRDLRVCGRAYPVANSLLMVLDKYEDMPRYQAVLDGLKLDGPQQLQRSSGHTEAVATGPPGPGPGLGSGASPGGGAAVRRSSRISTRGGGGGGASPRGTAAGPDSGSGADANAAAEGGGDKQAAVSLPRVTQLALRYNVPRSEMSKERQKFKERYFRRPSAALLQMLGMPQAMLELLDMQVGDEDAEEAGGAGQAGAAPGAGGGQRRRPGPPAEELLNLGFLERMTALTSLRLAVPLDPGSPRGGLSCLAPLTRLRRLDLLPISRLRSADLAPLGALGGCLQHLELYLDDTSTMHWHRRPEGYEPPDTSNLPAQGPVIFLSQRMMREYEYAHRVYPAWTRLNEVLSRLPRLLHLSITGAAPFWLPMGQHLLAQHPHIAHLNLFCTSAPAEFNASPVQWPAAAHAAAGATGPLPGSAGASRGPSPSGGAADWASRAAAGGRHIRVLVQHHDEFSLLQDAKQLLPLLPLQAQDEISLDICGVGAVSSEIGSQIRDLVAELPLRSLVMLHASWSDPRVAEEVLSALAAATTLTPDAAPTSAAAAGAASGTAAGAAAGPAAGAGEAAPAEVQGAEAAGPEVQAAAPAPEAAAAAAPAAEPVARRPARPGLLRKLQMWSRDKEAYDVSSRVLTHAEQAADARAAAAVASGAGRAAAVPSGPQELVLHGPLPDTLGPLLPPSLKRLSLANRTAEEGEAEAGTRLRRPALVQANWLPSGLEALDMQNMALTGTVPGCGLPQLSQLSLHCCAMGNLSQLAMGPQLRRLQLFRSHIGSSSMADLVDRCPGIVELNLQEAFSPDASNRRLNMSLACGGLLADLQHIGRLRKLESLALPIPHSCEGMGAMVPHLQALPSLHSLLVQGLWDLAVPSLTCLTALRRLEWLKLHMVVDTRCYSMEEPGAGGGAGGARGRKAARRRRSGRGAQRAAAPVEAGAAAGAAGPAGTGFAAGPSTGAPTPSRRRRAGAAAEAGSASAVAAGGNDAAPSSSRPLTRAAAAAAAAGNAAGSSQRGPDGAGERRVTRAAARAAAAAAPEAPRAKGAQRGGAKRAAAAPEQPSLAERPSKRQRRDPQQPASAGPSHGGAGDAGGAGPSNAHAGASAAADAGGAGPSNPAKAHADASPDAYNAHAVSQTLYNSLVEQLPYTKVGMKLITVTFKTHEEAANAAGQPGGGANENGGGGDGPVEAAAAAIAALAAALGPAPGAAGNAPPGGGGDGAAGANGAAAGNGGGGAQPPGGLGDGAPEGLLNMVMMGVAMAALGLPAPNVPPPAGLPAELLGPQAVPLPPPLAAVVAEAAEAAGQPPAGAGGGAAAAAAPGVVGAGHLGPAQGAAAAQAAADAAGDGSDEENDNDNDDAPQAGGPGGVMGCHVM